MNIVLIGMPGAGKSTVGVLLAKTLGQPFVDTDLIIQEKEKKKLHEIIKEYGIKQFLSIEEEHVLNLDVTDHVIATGGSVIYSSKAIEKLKKNSILIYLQVELEEIERRLKDITTRGIAMEDGVSLKDLYIERENLYVKAADLIIGCSGKTMEEVVAEIANGI